MASARTIVWRVVTVHVCRAIIFVTEVSTVLTDRTKNGAVRWRRRTRKFLLLSVFLDFPFEKCCKSLKIGRIFVDGKTDRKAAVRCEAWKCKLPDCWCSNDGKKIPGNLSVSDVPQMITITFDDAVNAENFDLYTSESIQASWPSVYKD